MQKRYVVDTNVLVTWLLNPESLAGKIIRSLELELVTPYKAISELWEHRDEWSTKAGGIDLESFTNALGLYVRIVYVDPQSREAKLASDAMRSVDPDDTEFLAAALMTGADVWSYDGHFSQQELVRAVKSEGILGSSHELPGLWEAVKDEYFRRLGRRRN